MRENRRVIMTKKLLKESLLELMSSKPLSKITIREICANADLNRTTFYAHYSDPFALYAEISNDAIEKTSVFLSQLSTDSNKINLLEEFLVYIKANEKVFRILLQTGADNSFKLRFIEICVSKLSKYDYHEGLSEEDKDYIFRFMFIGGLSVIEKWIENEFDKTPRQIAELIISLIPSITAVRRKQLHVADII